MKPKLSFRIIVYLIVFASYLILFLEKEKIFWLTLEDGLIESIGALFFLMASGLFFLAYYRSSQPGTDTNVLLDRLQRNVFYLLLGLLFVVSFGEEISWGQRIFGWETPGFLNEINSQRETNIHNIWFLNGRMPDQDQILIFGIHLNMNSYFSVFWLLFCVVVPIMDKVSVTTHSFLKHIRLPIVPLWIGGLFLSHAIFFHIIFNFLLDSIPARIDELRETNYAFMFFVFAYHEIIYSRKNRFA